MEVPYHRAVGQRIKVVIDGSMALRKLDGMPRLNLRREKRSATDLHILFLQLSTSSILCSTS